MVPDKRPSLHEAARRGVEAKQAAKSAQPPIQPPVQSPVPPPRPRQPGDRPPPPPVVAYEDVVASCGHPEKFGLFADRLDKFRRDRRKKVTDRPCRACRAVKAEAELEAAKVKQLEKQQRAEAAALAAKLPKKPPAAKQERLPDGAKFEVVYDATKTIWTGSLTIGDAVFSGTAGALFTLLNRLDRQFRQTLPGPTESAPKAE